MNWPNPPAEHHAIADGRHAHAIDRPGSPEDLASTLAQRVAEGLAIYPRGGGTAMHVGGPPARPGVLVESNRMTRIIDYPAADMTISVEAGITMKALQATLAREGQFLPLDTPESGQATLGGVYATNTWGPRRFGYGRPRDHIIGIRFAKADGTLVKGGGRVVKNVAGYDFPKLLTGSLGTLGVICEITLKVRPKAEDSALVVAAFTSLDALGNTLGALNTSATRPVAIDVLNAPAARHVLAEMAPSSPWVLVLGFEEAKATVSWQVDHIGRELGGADVRVVRGDEAGPVWSALTDFQSTGPGVVKLRVALPPSLLITLLGRIDPADWQVQAHAGTGTLHMQTNAGREMDQTAADLQRLRIACAKGGGHVIVASCPTEAKGPLKVWGDPRPDWALGARVKAALDPAGAMNPGRFFDTMGT